ncbi:hypothetical protein PsorP6_014624 [Peronosclerospora sorghi]|uniref:Uncharacterized protein n=1 Tax=Peronosclerospora sorghi TaxID=230839 RepID=A0ACC0VT24_9STRA|nr:hypothetical protein PsorP6_014624 [Peronosclerospora sorghi]
MNGELGERTRLLTKQRHVVVVIRDESEWPSDFCSHSISLRLRAQVARKHADGDISVASILVINWQNVHLYLLDAY